MLNRRLAILTAVFALITAAVLSVNSNMVQASIISYMNSLFGGEKASASIGINTEVIDSRNLVLLQAATNSDPNPEKATGMAPVVANALVPDMALAESSADVGAPNAQISAYTVRDGDTLSDIAEMFGVSVNTIMWANDIGRATTLRAGQTLIILPVTGVSYKIQKGDTIKGIALRYKADIDEILQYNDITLSSTLVVGQTIIIPDVEQPFVQSKNVSSLNSVHHTNGPSYEGYYMRPLVGGTRTQGPHGYNGVDIAGPVGTPILASAAGKVIASAGSGWNGGYGNVIIISHTNGTQTLYAHLSKNLVSVGQYVEQGEKIGIIGATGKVVGLTGRHLHFEVRGAKNPF